MIKLIIISDTLYNIFVLVVTAVVEVVVKVVVVVGESCAHRSGQVSGVG